jgi:hypothetical protein
LCAGDRTGNAAINTIIRVPSVNIEREAQSVTGRGDESVPKVVYIAGYGRSGSTLLDILLGNASRTAGCGELWGFFRVCDAGAVQERTDHTLPDFWQEVCAAFRRRMDGYTDAESVRTARRHFEELQALPLLLFGLVSRRSRSTYSRSQRALLGAIREKSDCEVVVDSSKTTRHCAGRPLALTRLAGVKVQVIHLVRDGRAVLWSQLRGSNAKLEKNAEDPRLAWAVPRTLYSWTMSNLACWLQGCVLPAGSVLRVRYEDLVANPEMELTRISIFTGLDLRPVIERITHGEPIPPGLQFAGNRMRLSGISQIRDDTEWQSRLPWLPRLAYWFFCWPWHFMFCRPVSVTHKRGAGA